MRSSIPFKLTRMRVLALAVILALAGAVVVVLTWERTPRPTLDVRDAADVHVDEAVTVRFDHPVDAAKLGVTVTPDTPVHMTRESRRIVIAPDGAWKPSQRYTVSIAPLLDGRGHTVVQAWHAGFATQPPVVATVIIDGRRAGARAAASPFSSMVAKFTVPMETGTVVLDLGGQPLPATAVAWNAEGTEATVSASGLVPYKPVTLNVPRSARSKKGDPMTEATKLLLTPLPAEPSNTTSGIRPGFNVPTPVEIVLDNATGARPQVGLQPADMVFEYISEYSITRMTAIYFNTVPKQIGPVRSCRMINMYLAWSFRGLPLCSGASVGTLQWLFGQTGVPRTPAMINDFDQGNHFYRTHDRSAPHNLLTDDVRAGQARDGARLPPPPFLVDPPHPDSQAGDAADPPNVRLHGVTYTYDPAGQAYLRFDHGRPFTEGGGAQLRVKNIVLMHVPFHDGGWIEDENGGAHSMWYDMLGSGPAEIWSDGKMIKATWHIGPVGIPPIDYWRITQAPWFTDAQGNVIELNTGLTWIHVLGNGQTQ